MQISFENKTVLVTGGTRGIGKSLVEMFSSLGATVIFTGRSHLSKNLGPKEVYYTVDFSIQASVDKFIKEIENHDVDVLINNAGINAINPVGQFRDSDWNEILAVNLTTPYRLIKTLSKGMINRGTGKIINVSSVYGLVGKSHRSAYCSSKFGIRGLTTAVAAELSQYNILVNAVAPGFTLTDLTTEILGPEGIAEVAKTIPIGRLAKPDEIAKAIAFLSSDLNTYISGQTITIDGGFTSV